MTAKRSAGIVAYRRTPGGGVEVLLVHPGGPFWSRRDHHVWSIPKGEYADGEDPKLAAAREFLEEVGQSVSVDRAVDLGEIRQRGGKVVRAWAVECDLDVTTVHSNTFRLEWPPGSGQLREFPEIDRAAWFSPETARDKIVPEQFAFLDRLLDVLSRRRPP
ncbi:MAG: NUDIX domain-containing protein [Acidothermus cellulolyticus]|nr:NUDIX domain-containing protein [Acidothermus cellulolyticus]